MAISYLHSNYIDKRGELPTLKLLAKVADVTAIASAVATFAAIYFGSMKAAGAAAILGATSAFSAIPVLGAGIVFAIANFVFQAG